MIPLIEREMIDRRGWVERKDFLELLTLAQSAPGPIALNSAVFVGYKVAGYKGAFCSVAGVVLPSFIIILLIAVYFSDIRDNRYVEAAFKGMRPAVIALIAAPILNLAKGMKLWEITVAVAAALIVWLLGVSPIWFIIAGAAAGILFRLSGRGRKPAEVSKGENGEEAEPARETKDSGTMEKTEEARSDKTDKEEER